MNSPRGPNVGITSTRMLTVITVLCATLLTGQDSVGKSLLPVATAYSITDAVHQRNGRSQSSIEDSTRYTTNGPRTATHVSRRDWMQACASTVGFASMLLSVDPAIAAAAPVVKVNPLEKILEAQDVLDKLLSNWKRATVDCTFADVPRELLETKNKELLLEKASTFALFDKSVSIETCKTTNRIVRDYLGATGKGPLVGLDKAMRKALDQLPDPDDLEVYVEEIESISQALSRATSLSYAAGVADFDSVNNFSKEQSDDVREQSNLSQTKEAIQEVKKGLDRIILLLQKEA